MRVYTPWIGPKRGREGDASRPRMGRVLDHSGRGTVNGVRDKIDVLDNDLSAEVVTEECMQPRVYLTRGTG